MTSLKAALRHEEIIRMLHQNGSVRVEDLATALDVSGVTIRSDLVELEEQRLLTRTRGGAIMERLRRFEISFAEDQKEHIEEKRAIGRWAASRVKNNDTIMLDVGATTTEVARALPRTLEGVYVFTNSLNIALELEDHPGITVVVTGGTLRSGRHALVAPFGTTMLQDINVDMVFLGCSGVHPERGFTNSSLQEAEMGQAMMATGSKVYFVADHSKIGLVATSRICRADSPLRLITDESADPQVLAKLRDCGIGVKIAKA